MPAPRDLTSGSVPATRAWTKPGSASARVYAEAERLKRLFRRLLARGVSVSLEGLGCVSTPMAEVEFLLEAFAACVNAEA